MATKKRNIDQHPAMRATEELEPTLQPTPAPVPAEPTPAPVQAEPTPAPEPDATVALNERIATLEAERASWAASASETEARFRAQAEADRIESEARLSALEARHATTSREAEERASQLAAIEREKRFTMDFTGLEHVDSVAAQELHEKIFRPALEKVTSAYEERVNALTAQIAETREKAENGVKTMQQRQDEARFASLNARILAQHSDFTTVVQTPEYQAFASQTIPGSRTTYGAELRAAYDAGDTDFVAATLATFKAGRPALGSTASVATTGVATTPSSAHAAQPKFTYSDLADIKDAYRKGDLTQKQYSTKLEAFYAAEAAGGVL